MNITTPPFCVADPSFSKDQLLVQVTGMLTEALKDQGISFHYFNILDMDMDMDSELYNPDNAVGRIRITKQP